MGYATFLIETTLTYTETTAPTGTRTWTDQNWVEGADLATRKANAESICLNGHGQTLKGPGTGAAGDPRRSLVVVSSAQIATR